MCTQVLKSRVSRMWYILAWNRSLQAKFLLKYVSQELKFSQNQWKFGLQMHYSPKKLVSGAVKGLEMVGLWSLKVSLQKGVLRAAHPRTTFQRECPPPRLNRPLLESIADENSGAMTRTLTNPFQNWQKSQHIVITMKPVSLSQGNQTNASLLSKLTF